MNDGFDTSLIMGVLAIASKKNHSGGNIASARIDSDGTGEVVDGSFDAVGSSDPRVESQEPLFPFGAGPAKKPIPLRMSGLAERGVVLKFGKGQRSDGISCELVKTARR